MRACIRVLLVILCVYVISVRTRLLHRMSGNHWYSPQKLVAKLHNQRLLLMGDSLMRYQYLSLVYFLHHGEFPDSDGHANMLQEKLFPSWTEFLNYTNSQLLPNEFCDCHRNPGYINYAEIYENRYYRDEVRNISITYIQYFGDTRTLHGHFTVDDSTHLLRSDPWIIDHVEDLLRNITHYVYPAPSVLLFNAGFHPHYYDNAQHREKIVQTALSKFSRVIWKTTNMRIERLSTGRLYDEPYDEVMCYYPGIECLDLSWTAILYRSDYWDAMHMNPPMYGDINVQFIELLHSGKHIKYTPFPTPNCMVNVTDSIPPMLFLVDRQGRLLPYQHPHISFDNSTATLATPTASSTETTTISETSSSVTTGQGQAMVCHDSFAHMPIQERTMESLMHHILGNPVVQETCFSDVYKDGTLVRLSSSRSIFLIDHGQKREFQSWGAFVRMGFDTDQVKIISDDSETELQRMYFDSLPLGPPIV